MKNREWDFGSENEARGERAKHRTRKRAAAREDIEVFFFGGVLR